MMSMTSSRKRKAAYKTKNSSKAKAAYVTKQDVKRLLPKIEVKEFRNHLNEVSLNTLSQGQFNQVTGPSQGTGRDQRVGNEITAMSLDVSGVLYNNSTTESLVRMLIVSCSTGTDPSLELFDSTSAGATGGLLSINGLDAMYYPINRNDFRVHKDKLYRLAGSATGNAGSNVQIVKHYVKFPKRRVKFDGTGTGLLVQNWITHIIYIAADANDDTSTGTVAEVSHMARFRYTDA